MAFDDLKDKLIEGFGQTKERVIENPHVQTIIEKYQTLPARTQQIVMIVLCICAALILASIPYSFFSSSANNVADFNKHRDLTRNIFKYSQLPKGKSPLPASANASSLASQIRSSLSRFDLLPTQIATIEETPLKSTGKALMKKPIIQTAVKASFKQINVKQIVDISFHLKNLKDHMKLINTDIKEDNTKKQYYNVDFKLVSYAYPVKKEPIDKKKKSKKKRKKRKKKSKK